LNVLLVENRDRFLKASGNRGPEWADHEPSGYAVSEIPTFRVAKGERVYYLAKRLSGLRRTRPDAVVLGGWESPAYWQALAWCKRRRVRTVGFYESTLTTHRHRAGLIAAARRWFFRHLDAVVVPGTAAREAIVAMGVSPENIHVGFNAVDVDQIHQQTWQRRESATASAPGHQFLYLGQLIERKNVASLVEAFSRVRGQDDTLTIAGVGDREVALRLLVEQLDVAENVRFVGLVPYAELPALFAAHKTLVLPSIEDVWGLVVNEALAAGLHVVVSNTCGVAPSVDGMKGVFLAHPALGSIARNMRASADSWTAPIRNPEILEMTPARFADVFVQALDGKYVGMPD
jgi:glycosyltransferase involved in cell wall biosynthesis